LLTQGGQGGQGVNAEVRQLQVENGGEEEDAEEHGAHDGERLPIGGHGVLQFYKIN
jgi:hypothetical protein